MSIEDFCSHAIENSGFGRNRPFCKYESCKHIFVIACMFACVVEATTNIHLSSSGLAIFLFCWTPIWDQSILQFLSTTWYTTCRRSLLVRVSARIAAPSCRCWAASDRSSATPAPKVIRPKVKQFAQKHSKCVALLYSLSICLSNVTSAGQHGGRVHHPFQFGQHIDGGADQCGRRGGSNCGAQMPKVRQRAHVIRNAAVAIGRRRSNSVLYVHQMQVRIYQSQSSGQLLHC